MMTALTTKVAGEGAGPVGGVMGMKKGVGAAGRTVSVRRVVGTKKGVAAVGPTVTAAVQVVAAQGTTVTSGVVEDTGLCESGQSLQS